MTQLKTEVISLDRLELKNLRGLDFKRYTGKNQGNQNKYSTKVTGLRATLPHAILINHSNGLKMHFFVQHCLLARLNRPRFSLVLIMGYQALTSSKL